MLALLAACSACTTSQGAARTAGVGGLMTLAGVVVLATAEDGQVAPGGQQGAGLALVGGGLCVAVIGLIGAIALPSDEPAAERAAPEDTTQDGCHDGADCRSGFDCVNGACVLAPPPSLPI